MTDLNPRNERIKRRYFRYLEDADGLAPVTIENAARTIAAYERSTGWEDFRKFNPSMATAYRRHLLAGSGRRAAELSSRATVRSKLLSLKKFFVWLSGQEGYRSRISASDGCFFDLPRRERRIANERRNDEAPSVEQIRHVILSMPADTDREKRDRALMAFLLLTGARVRATASFRLRHVLPSRLGILQDGRDVATKGGRTFQTAFFPVGDDILAIFLDWERHLRETMLFAPDDPLFPASDTIAATRGDTHKLSRRHWKTADPIRSICRSAFDAAAVPYQSPHTIRRTLAVLGEQRCRTADEFKAWSQNLGHLEMLTTFTSYGGLSDRRQFMVMSRLIENQPNILDELEKILRAKGYEPRFEGGDAK